MGDFFNASQFDTTNNAAGGAQTKNTDNQNLVHVSASQVAKLTRREEGLVIHRQKANTIICIGVVVSVEELTTKNVYVIDDYTLGSPIEVQLWKSENDGIVLIWNSNITNAFSLGSGNFVPPPPIMERTYIKVIGQPRYDDRKPFIVAFRVEPIVDPNEIYTHFLQVIHDSMFLEKRLNANLNRGVDNGNGANISTNQFDQSSRMMAGFSEVQRSVLNILNKYGRDLSYGLKRYEIKNYMPGVNSSMIDEAISFLVNEGHIFSTTDEDTFQSTNYWFRKVYSTLLFVTHLLWIILNKKHSNIWKYSFQETKI